MNGIKFIINFIFEYCLRLALWWNVFYITKEKESAQEQTSKQGKVYCYVKQ